MFKPFYTVLIILILFNLFECTSVRQKKNITNNPSLILKNGIDYLLADPNVQNSQIGIYIESLSDQKILYRKNEYKLFIPASNMKLFTTAAAYSLLGDDFRFRTSIKTNGRVSSDTLIGDLIVKGGGDPTFSGRFYNGCTLCALTSWADSLQLRGIKVIKGAITADESYFSGAVLGEGWDWDDLPFWYAAESSPLSLNDNCVDLTIYASDSTGRKVKYTIDPPLETLQIINNTITISEDSLSTLKINRTLGKNEIIISGEFPKNHVLKRSVTVHHPSQFFIQALETVLRDNGIMILQTDHDNFADSLRTLFTYYSPPLAQIVKVINKRSQNFYAEQLLKTIGAYVYGEGSFNSGIKAVNRWLYSIGVDDNEFIMVDGSGLSRKNYISPRTAARLLEYLPTQNYFLQFYNSLPISATDGTLKKRMINTPAAGAVHAKTGTMSHVKNLSGYLRGKDGKLYLFIILANNFSVPTSYIANMQDRICVLLYNYSAAL